MNWADKEYAIGRGVAAIRHKKGTEYKQFIKAIFDYKLPVLLSAATGSIFPNVSRSQVENLEINIPPLPEQKAIAAVLSAFDDKIELLREQNQTLETLAQTIFKEWFVHFNFPDKDGKPYKDNGGEMVDSELGEIPKGWRVGKLGDIVKIKGGGTPSTKNPDFWNGDIYWTSPKDLSNTKSIFLFDTEKKITKEGLEKISSGLLPKGTLLLSSRAPIGYLSISSMDGVAINQGYIALIEGAYLSNSYMFFWLKTFMRLLTNFANGSTFLEISKTAFRNIDCMIPDKITLEKFDIFVESIFKKIKNNTAQIQTLSKTRDTLLPKLMNGEIRVQYE